MTVSQEEIKEAILNYIKSSWDKVLSSETKSVFFVLAVPNKQVSVNNLTFDARLNISKIAICLSALEALQLITVTKSGVSKLCELSELGWIFVERYNLKEE